MGHPNPMRGKTNTDWQAKLDEASGNRFELLNRVSDPRGEQTLFVVCRECGAFRAVRSITLRHTGLWCRQCKAIERYEVERTKELNRQEREWNSRKNRGRTLVQMSMNFCECGRLLPFGVKLCEECKVIKARQRERTREHRRRVREQQGFDRTITLEKLYERDHGVCYLCNKTCDWQDFQRINGNFIVGGSYPTVEHVKALCKGGTHSWDNVKLACFACNSKKGRQ